MTVGSLLLLGAAHASATLPLLITEYHDEVLVGWLQALRSGEKHTIVHFDSHPDMDMPREPFNTAHVKQAPWDVMHSTEIQSFLLAAVWAGLTERIIWVHPPWSLDYFAKPADFEILISERDGSFVVGMAEEFQTYWRSSRLAKLVPVDEMRRMSKVCKVHFTMVAPGAAQEVVASIPKSEPVILDIDEDYFTTESNFVIALRKMIGIPDAVQQLIWNTKLKETELRAIYGDAPPLPAALPDGEAPADLVKEMGLGKALHDWYLIDGPKLDVINRLLTPYARRIRKASRKQFHNDLTQMITMPFHIANADEIERSANAMLDITHPVKDQVRYVTLVRSPAYTQPGIMPNVECIVLDKLHAHFGSQQLKHTFLHEADEKRVVCDSDGDSAAHRAVREPRGEGATLQAGARQEAVFEEETATVLVGAVALVAIAATALFVSRTRSQGSANRKNTRKLAAKLAAKRSKGAKRSPTQTYCKDV